MRTKYFLLGILFSIVLVLLAVLSFYFGKKSNNSNPVTVAKNEPLPTLAITPTPIPLNPEMVKEAIVFAIKNKNFENLSGYISSPVSFRIENSGCCEPQTPVQAVKQLEYLNSTGGIWSFDQKSDVAKSLAASYPENYSNAFIGTTSDFYSVAFQFSDDGKINKISISSSYKLLLE
jgi:hypothetical protein